MAREVIKVSKAGSDRQVDRQTQTGARLAGKQARLVLCVTSCFEGKRGEARGSEGRSLAGLKARELNLETGSRNLCTYLLMHPCIERYMRQRIATM
jgi:hypothetical protein